MFKKPCKFDGQGSLQLVFNVTITKRLNKSMGTREISSALRKALLKGENNMSLALYQDKMVKHIDEWYEGLKTDRENYAIVLTERAGELAMAIIDKDKNIYVNEEAKDKLSKIWTKNYTKNIKFLIPMMADHINEAVFSITGVSVIEKTPKRSKAIGMGQRFTN